MTDKPNEVSVEGCIEFLEHEQREPRIGWTRFDTLGSSIRALRRYAQMESALSDLLKQVTVECDPPKCRVACHVIDKARAALKGPSP